MRRDLFGKIEDKGVVGEGQGIPEGKIEAGSKSREKRSSSLRVQISKGRAKETEIKGRVSERLLGTEMVKRL
jgi:hypothetical protein